MATVFFVDIDATITFTGDRLKNSPKERNRRSRVYKEWLKKVQSLDALMKDTPVRGMRDLCWSLYKSNEGASMIYLTSRNEIFRDVTNYWLEKFNFPDAELIMREEKNKLPYYKYKEQKIKEYIKANRWAVSTNRFNIVVIDDDPENELVHICNRNNWTFLKAQSGSNT